MVEEPQKQCHAGCSSLAALPDSPITHPTSVKVTVQILAEKHLSHAQLVNDDQSSCLCRKVQEIYHVK